MVSPLVVPFTWYNDDGIIINDVKLDRFDSSARFAVPSPIYTYPLFTSRRRSRKSRVSSPAFIGKSLPSSCLAPVLWRRVEQIATMSGNSNGGPSLGGSVWEGDYVNEEWVACCFTKLNADADCARHVQAFERALSLSDHLPIEGDASPISPRSPPLHLEPDAEPRSSTHLHQRWSYGPDNGTLAGRERVEKLAATSDFAVRQPAHLRTLVSSFTDAKPAHSPACLEVRC